MANYQTTVTLAAPPAGNVLLPGGSTVITYSVDVGAQAAVAALMSGYATWNSDHTGLVIGGVAVPASASRIAALDSVPATIMGHSYTARTTTDGTDIGGKFFERFAKQQNTLTPTNYGVGGRKMAEILTQQVEPNWLAGGRGLVMLMGVLNDVSYYGDTAGAATTAEALRAIFARLCAVKVAGDVSDSGIFFGPGWVNGATSTVNSYADVAFQGDTAYITIGRVTGAGGTFTITDTSGTLLATVTTGGFKDPFNGVTKISGLGSGGHTVRVQLTSGSGTLVGFTVPGPTPAQVVWAKEGPILLAGYPTGKNALLKNTYLTACAAVAADFAAVIPVDVDANWDPATMLASTTVAGTSDLTHPNDIGANYWANLLTKALAGVTVHQGLNRLTTATNGTENYTNQVPAYRLPAATVPAAPTGLAATTTSQIQLSWARSTDGGATVTKQTVQYSSNGGSTWSNLADVPAAATSYAIFIGLTQGSSYVFRVTATNAVGTSSPSATATATAGASVTTYAADTFTRANDSANPGSTETGSLAWVVTDGVFGISSNTLSCVSVVNGTFGATALYDDGHADGTVQMTRKSLGAEGLYVRGSASSFTGLMLWQNNASYSVTRRTGQTTFASIQVIAGVTPTGSDVLKAVMNGTSVLFYINGTLVYTHTDTIVNTQTRHGVIAFVAGQQFDDHSHNSLTA